MFNSMFLFYYSMMEYTTDPNVQFEIWFIYKCSFYSRKKHVLYTDRYKVVVINSHALAESNIIINNYHKTVVDHLRNITQYWELRTCKLLSWDMFVYTVISQLYSFCLKLSNFVRFCLPQMYSTVPIGRESFKCSQECLNINIKLYLFNMKCNSQVFFLLG